MTTDVRRIPAGESRHLYGSFGEWIKALVTHKLFRSKAEPTFAFELKRLVRVEPEQVSKRIMKQFDPIRRQIGALGFLPNFYASLPSIGPVAGAVMTMSRKDGQVHSLACQYVIQKANRITDEGYFGFTSRTTSGSLIMTISSASLPRSRPGLDRVIVGSSDPDAVLRAHRKRIRNAELIAVPPADLFERTAEEMRLESEDQLRRRIIRPATAGEITRIKNESRV